jgi:hypothetical protein
MGKRRRQNERIPEGFLIKSKTYGTHKVLIDEEDWDRVKERFWGTHSIKPDGTFYVGAQFPHPAGGEQWRTGKMRPRETRVGLHRFVMNCPKGMEVDHINHNKLDNRKENLRICTRSENGKNLRKTPGHGTSQFKGVQYSPKASTMIKERSKPWQAGIRANGTQHSLGMFATEEEAAMVYDEASRKHHGEYGVLNFPDGVPEEIMTIIEQGRANVPDPSSKYHGVMVEKSRTKGTQRKRPNRYIKVSMNVNGKITHYGSYSSEEEAAWERDKIVKELGLDKPLNFPDGLADEILSIIEAGKKEYQKAIDEQHIYEVTKYKGVENPSGKLYYVKFWDSKEKKQIRIGSYWTREEAKLARNKAMND